MPKNGLTIEEAALRLQVSTRTVRTYMKQGFLSAKKLGGSTRKLLDPHEVETLRAEKEEYSNKSLVSRQEVLQLRSRLARVESQMAVVLRVLDAQAEPLGLTVETGSQLHEACVLSLHTGDWDLEGIEHWTEILLRLSEQDFECMLGVAPHPWRPFLQLVTALSTVIVRHADYETSLERQRLHRLLAEARRRLRVAVVCFSELHGSIDPALRRAAVEATGSLHDAVERKVKKVLKRLG